MLISADQLAAVKKELAAVECKLAALETEYENATRRLQAQDAELAELKNPEKKAAQENEVTELRKLAESRKLQLDKFSKDMADLNEKQKQERDKQEQQKQAEVCVCVLSYHARYCAGADSDFIFADQGSE